MYVREYTATISNKPFATIINAVELQLHKCLNETHLASKRYIQETQPPNYLIPELIKL